MKQNRLKSPMFWSAIFAQVLSLGQMSGLWVKLGVDTGTLGNVWAGVLQLAVLLGLLNDPTSKNQF